MPERIQINLNPSWRFFPGNAPEAFQKSFDDTAWQTVTLPHDWSVEADFSEACASGTGYLPGGIGWYRKRFDLPCDLRAKRVFVTFQGVYCNSQVWCNGNNLGNRPNGYSSFTYEITAYVRQHENLLSVRVDHRDFIDSRWFTGSGIYRDVVLTITGETCFAWDSVFAWTKKADSRSADLAVQWKAEAGPDAAVRLSLLHEGKAVAETRGSASPLGFSVPRPRLWSPESPALYTLRAELWQENTLQDSIEFAFGIRTFRFDPQKGFFLNGESQKLRGVCLHHDAGALGAAVPREVWHRRLYKLKHMGCNAIRTSHNPPDPAFLDLCDRMGFLVMNEAFDEWEGCKNKWWQGHNIYPPKHEGGYSEHFPVWHERDLRDFVRRDRNHPSVILWSIGNEVDYPNDPYSYPLPGVMQGNNDRNKPLAEMLYDSSRPGADRLGRMAQELAAIVRRHDPTRPVTAAIAYPEVSECTGYTAVLDAVGYNYKEHLYEKALREHPDRVYYGSENFHDAALWAAVRDHEAISGQFLWTGIDYLGEASLWPERASRAGTLTLAGMEKPRYWHRRALWSGEDSLVLGARTQEDEEEQLHWNWENGQPVEVIAYTNCEEAELFLNGVSQGLRQMPADRCGRLSWCLPFEPGTVTVKGRRTGRPVTASLQTAGEPERLLLRPWRQTVPADGRSLIQVELTLADAAGYPALHGEKEIKWHVRGDAALLAVESGAVDDMTAYRHHTRKTCGGRMLAYIRAGNTPGTVEITAQAKNCISETIQIKLQ